MEDDPDGVTPRLEPGGAGPPQKMLIIGSTTANGESNISFHARNNDFEKFAENHMPNRKRKQSDSTIPDEEEDETEDPLVFVSQNMPTVYEDDHRGPFTVYVDTAKAEPRTPINQYRLAKKLLDLKVGDIDNIIKIGYSRCKVTFRSRSAANNFVNGKQLESAGYTPRIFAHLLTKTGIVFNIPEEISMKELSAMLTSPVPIVKLIRMTRKNGNERCATMKVKVVFRGLNIPKEMDFAFTKLITKPFIPFGQCYNCFKFNHMADNCKQKEKTCGKCFTKHTLNSDCDTGMITCTNCKNLHPPTDRNCPAREKALNLKRIMILENLSIREARTKYAGIIGGNRFEILGDDGVEVNFPQLRTRPDKIIDNSIEAARHVHRNQSFAKVTKSNPNRIREEERARKDMDQWRQLNRENQIVLQEKRDIENPHSVTEVERLATQLKTLANSFFSKWGDDSLSSNDRRFVGEIARALDRALITKDRDEIIASTSGAIAKNY